MVFDRILVPTDGSEFTKTAIRTAMELAKYTGGKVTALYVVDQTLFMNVPVDSAIASVYTVLKKEGQDAVDLVRNIGNEFNVDVEVKVVDGAPVRAILEESGNHDVIVMGTLGRTGMSKLPMGSVAEKIVRHSKIPVMVVRSPEVDNK